MGTRYDGVIFDLDGVLVETEHLWQRGWAAVALARGCRWTPEDTRRARGMSAPEWCRYLAERAGVPQEADQVRQECVQFLIRKILNGEAPLADGARELVVSAAASVPVGLVSSAARRVIEALLAEHDLGRYFAAICSSEEVPHGKPAPDGYLEVARRLGLAPGRGIAVEDSSTGLRAAHAAGLTLVAMANRRYPPAPDALALADFVAADHAVAREYIVGLLAQ